MFKFVTPANILNLSNEQNPVDLVILGECKKFKNGVDITDLGEVKSVLLNTESSCGVIYSDREVQIITCGLKEKDTAIFSSINIDECSVIFDLQRSVKNIYGETLEPFEKQIIIPESVKKESAEDLILSLTALTLCGRI